MGNVKKTRKASLNHKAGLLNMEDSYESNLPTVDDLKGYEDVLPGLAGRIVDMAEKEQRFRHKTVPSAINKFFILSLGGMIGGLVVLSILLFFSYLLIEKGETSKSIGFLLGAIGIIVVPFILNGLDVFKNTKNQEIKKDKKKKLKK